MNTCDESHEKTTSKREKQYESVAATLYWTTLHQTKAKQRPLEVRTNASIHKTGRLQQPRTILCSALCLVQYMYVGLYAHNLCVSTRCLQYKIISTEARLHTPYKPRAQSSLRASEINSKTILQIDQRQDSASIYGRTGGRLWLDFDKPRLEHDKTKLRLDHRPCKGLPTFAPLYTHGQTRR